jgi:hypothetical protein
MAHFQDFYCRRNFALAAILAAIFAFNPPTPPQELDSTTKLPFTMNLSEQIVDIVGNTAVIHGLNTLMQDGKVLSRARFTDVFVLQNGTWMALSAQETSL